MTARYSRLYLACIDNYKSPAYNDTHDMLLGEPGLLHRSRIYLSHREIALSSCQLPASEPMRRNMHFWHVDFRPEPSFTLRIMSIAKQIGFTNIEYLRRSGTDGRLKPARIRIRIR